ncbi:MAG: dockerin type I domain-containing protein [Planctomycetota bacterium]|nr:dockerin type I domain-containing protein [Planctomycetota bacterium]
MGGLFTDAIHAKRRIRYDSAWQNPSQVHDVDDNKSIDPLDVLNLINYINLNGSGSLPGTRPSNSLYGYVDVDGDMQVSPLDVLRVINMINASRNAEGEATQESSERQEGQFSDLLNFRLESIELSDMQHLKKIQNRAFLLLSKRQYQ